MKSLQVEATFPIPLLQWKKLYVDDPHFQQKVQEEQGHKGVVVSDWSPKSQDTDKQTFERKVNFHAPVNAPTAVKKFLKMDFVEGISTADYVSYTQNSDVFEGSTIMEMLSGALKGKLIVTIRWKATASSDKKATTLNVTITCEFKKQIPVLSPLIENACASNAQKNYETWIEIAKKTIQGIAV